MAKATTFMKGLRTVGRANCQWWLLRRLGLLPPPVWRRRRGKPAAVVGTSCRRGAVPAWGRGDTPGFGSIVGVISSAPQFFLSALSCRVQFSSGMWDPLKARRRADPTGHPYRCNSHIGDTGGLLLDTKMVIIGECLTGKSSNCMSRERRFHPTRDMAIPSPEVSQCATTALSAWTFPCSKFPSAVASLVWRVTKRPYPWHG